MRFCHITAYYEEFLRRMYRARPGLRSAGYAEQHAAVVAERNAWSDFLVRNLAAMGHETSLVIANYAGAQRQWAREHGVRLGSNWRTDAVLAQLVDFRPDVVFFEDTLSFPASFVREIRTRVSSVRAVVAYLGIVRTDVDLLREADLVVTCAEEITEQVQREGHRAVTILHAFEPSVLRELTPRAHPIDVSFAGSVIPGVHANRHELLCALVAAGVNLELYCGSLRTDNPLSLLRYVGRAVRSSPGALTWLWGPLRKHIRTEVFGKAMLEVVFNSRISLNNHGDAVTFAANMRLFEITGCGSCLVTDWKPNLAQLFEPGSEVMTYRSQAECIEVVKWLLENEEERERIARAGQQRTLRDHTFRARSVELADHIGALLGRRDAVAVGGAGKAAGL